MSSKFKVDTNFQTPEFVCEYMVSLVDKSAKTFLEPTPGEGNIVKKIVEHFPESIIRTPWLDYFDSRDNILSKRYDQIIMNPPFSEKSFYCNNLPKEWEGLKGMAYGYKFLTELMPHSDNIIALMPWFTISDSDVRMRMIQDFGLKSVTLLPRRTFQYARIQTVVLEMKKSHQGITEFKYLR